jgi:hypothetical protein
MLWSTNVLFQVGTGDCKVKSVCSTLAHVFRSSNFSLEKNSSLKLKLSIFVHSNCRRITCPSAFIIKKIGVENIHSHHPDLGRSCPAFP